MFSAALDALPVCMAPGGRRLWSPSTCRLHSPGWMSPSAVVLSAYPGGMYLTSPVLAACVRQIIVQGNTGLHDVNNITWCTLNRPAKDSPPCSHNAKSVLNDPAGAGEAVVIGLLLHGEVLACVIITMIMRGSGTFYAESHFHQILFKK